MLLVHNAPQERLLSDMEPEIALGKITISEENSIFDKINNFFPFNGSSIDWANVPNSVDEKPDAEDYFVSARYFLEKIIDKIALKDEDVIVVVGDSAVGVALTLTVGDLKKHLDALLTMPQHTYVVSPDISWCICFRMEGHMSFGLTPKDKH